MAITKSKLNVRTRRHVDRLGGKWVAFVDGRVVDSASTLPALAEKIRHKKFPSKPAVMLVPRNDEGPYILVIV